MISYKQIFKSSVVNSTTLEQPMKSSYSELLFLVLIYIIKLQKYVNTSLHYDYCFHTSSQHCYTITVLIPAYLAQLQGLIVISLY